MANTVNNVSTGKPLVSGAIYRAEIGAVVPEGTGASLSADYKPMGYVSEDGLTNSNSPDTSTGKAWGGDIVITYQNEKSDTFSFTLIESLNPDVLAATYGTDNVSGDLTSGITVKANSKEGEDGVWVFDMLMRNGVLKRVVAPIGKVIELGDIVYKDDELVGYELTIQAFPDAEGNTHYEYIKADGDVSM